MTQQYEDFMASINIEIFPSEQNAVRQYIRKVNLLKALAIGCLMVELIAMFLNSGIKYFFYILTIILIISYGSYRTSSSKKIRGILLEECNPGKMMSFLGALLIHTHRNKNWDKHFYNIAMALFYGGRFSDVEKILPLLKKYCPGTIGDFKYEAIAANMAYYREDEEELIKHCEVLNKIASGIRLNGFDRAIYEEKMHYPHLLNMKHDQNYPVLYKEYLDAQFMRGSMLGEVRRNYYLYETALAMGDGQRAEQHKKFVLMNGGTLWYKADLEEKQIT